MTVAFAFVLASVGLFIRYIDHVANIIRAATIVTYIGTQSRRVLEQRYPSDLTAGGVRTPVSPAVLTVPAPHPGVVVSVNEQVLVELAADADAVLVLIPRLGDFVPAGAPLLTIHPEPDRPAMDAGELETLGKRVIGALALDTERTMEQDLAFGFRQLVDIAERALSPGINDPTTAAQALDVLHDLLRRLATRHLPDGRSVGADGRLRFPGRIHVLLADLASAALPEHRGAVDRWTALVGLCPVIARRE